MKGRTLLAVIMDCRVKPGNDACWAHSLHLLYGLAATSFNV
jgi:hypothetical protein